MTINISTAAKNAVEYLKDLSSEHILKRAELLERYGLADATSKQVHSFFAQVRVGLQETVSRNLVNVGTGTVRVCGVAESSRLNDEYHDQKDERSHANRVAVHERLAKHQTGEVLEETLQRLHNAKIKQAKALAIMARHGQAMANRSLAGRNS
jgi:hypothetical protein